MNEQAMKTINAILCMKISQFAYTTVQVFPRVTKIQGWMGIFLAVFFVLLASLPVIAKADRNLAWRYSLNANGDIAWIGNVNLTCPASAGCTSALDGTDAGGRNDNFNMTNLDLDGIAGTTNSSAAKLSIPAGSTIEYARLYWSARRSTNSTARTQISFRPAGAGSYSTITADTTDVSSVLDTTNYQSSANVTTQVKAAGNGTYWVANIHAVTGGTVDYAAWALVVVYSNPVQPFRNLTIFDGLKSVQNSSTNFDITGFLTPFNGPVVTRLGVLGYEGDRPTAADYVRVNGTNMSNGPNPANNFFNATISNFGVKVTDSTPSYDNNLQFDLDVLNVPSGVVPNGSESATIAIGSSSSNEAFALAAVSFSTEIYVPEVVPNVVKTAEDMSPETPLLPGDTLRWHVVMSNTGYDSATNLIATDIIPPYLTYKSGSLVIASGANTGAKTDAQYDDQVDFLTGPDRVVFRLGQGANALQGGTLAYGQSTSFYFDTIVDANIPAGTVLTNSVAIEYNSQTIPTTTFAASSAAATTVVTGPPTITKSISPSVIDANQNAVMTITVANPSSNTLDLEGVSFSDAYPAGMVNTAAPNPQLTCTPGATAGTRTGGVANGNSIGMSPGATIPPNGSCIITVNVTSASAGSYTNTTSAVTAANGGTGGTATATLYVGKPRISKAFSPATINAGQTSTVTFSLQNMTASPLTQVAFSDALTNMQVAAAPNVVGNCGGGTVTAVANSASIALAGGTLTASGSCMITVAVTSSTAGTWPNTTTGVSSAESGSAGQPSNTAELTVIGPPLISKMFAPVSVGTGTPSVLSITVTNPNTGATLNNVNFSDPYPNANLKNTTPFNGSVMCSSGSTPGAVSGIANGSSIGLGNSTLLPGGSCTVMVSVQSGSEATYTNITGAVGSSAGAGGTATAALIVADRLTPAPTKVFLPASIAYNDPVTSTYTSSTMTITVGVNTGDTVTGVNFEDIFPAGMIVANTPNAGVTGSGCSGAVLEGRTGTGAWGTVASGNTAIRMTGASIAGTGGVNNSRCEVSVNVTANSSGTYANTTGTFYSSNGGTAAPVTDTLTVLGPPVVTKSFSPTTISPCTYKANNPNRERCDSTGKYSTLTITLSNPGTGTLDGISVTDSFPTGLKVNGVPTVSNNCGGTSTFTNLSNGTIAVNDTGVKVSNVSLASGTSCFVSVNVMSADAGQYDNKTQNVTSTNGGKGGTAQATLWVAVPMVEKSFSCTQPIIANTGTCTLRIDITAPSSSALSNARVIDIFPLETPSGGDFKLTNATLTPSKVSGTGNCPSFTFKGRTGSSSYPDLTLPMASLANTAVGNTAIVAEANADIPAGVKCRISATVTSSMNSTNIIPVGGLTGKIGSNDTSNATATQAILQVYDTPTVVKSFSVPSMLVNGTTQLTIEISHLNSNSATGVAFEDPFPASVSPAGGQMRLATPLTYSSSCNGTLQSRNPNNENWRTLTAGDTGLKLSGPATILGASSCIITANVTADQAGDYTNNIDKVTTSNYGDSEPASANIKVMGPPTIAKAFTPNAIIVNETSLLTVTLTNPNGTLPITGVAFTDTYPTGLVNTATPNASTSCPGATLTAAANGNSLAMSGATIPAGGSCSVIVQVTSATAKVSPPYTNTIAAGGLTTTNAGTNAAAVSATLTVNPLLPVLNLLKQVSTYSDPINNTSNPKAIPGAVMTYVIRLSNTGLGTVDAGSIFLNDELPSNVDLYVGTGPTLSSFSFTDGSPVSGLTACVFGNQNNGSDCVDFSTDGSTWTYTPVPDADGFDPAIRHIRFRPSGPFNATGGGNPWAEFSFRVRLK